MGERGNLGFASTTAREMVRIPDPGGRPAPVRSEVSPRAGGRAAFEPHRLAALADLLCDLGRYGEALHRANRAMRRGRESEDRLAESVSLLCPARVHHGPGRVRVRSAMPPICRRLRRPTAAVQALGGPALRPVDGRQGGHWSWGRNLRRARAAVVLATSTAMNAVIASSTTQAHTVYPTGLPYLIQCRAKVATAA